MVVADDVVILCSMGERKMDGLYDDIMQERIRAQAKSVHSGIILCDSVQEIFNGR